MNPVISTIKRLLPDREMPLKVIRGPFRGGVFYSNPQFSLRKVFGFYEHELNSWLGAVLPRVDCIIDVGANDGYFTYGCAAALQRLGCEANIVAYEPLAQHVAQLKHALELRSYAPVSIKIVDRLVGKISTVSTAVLDELLVKRPDSRSKGALVKIDVEGAELDVIAGASRWLRPENFFLIEVHQEDYLDSLRATFGKRGLALKQVDQNPLPLLGREHRDERNWWLVTDLGRAG